MDDATERRLGENEALAREVNEAIERGLWPGEEDDPVQFRCECARADCSRPIELTLTAYERVRVNPRRFLLVDGHELFELDDVIERGGAYVIVEKRGQAAGPAERSDPRG